MQKQERRQPKQKQNKAHKNKQQTKQQKTRQHGWWSADQFIVLAMYNKDDSFVSPRDWYGRGKTTTKTERPQQCHTEICEPGINKSTMRKPTLPSQEPRDHKVQPHGQHSHRLSEMIPKPVMTQSWAHGREEFFSVQRLHGFRQVVQHVQFHVAK